MDTIAYYPVTLAFRNQYTEQAYIRYRVARTLYRGDYVCVCVRITIFIAYFAVADHVHTYFHVSLEAAGVVLHLILLRVIRREVYIVHREPILLLLRIYYTINAAFGIPNHLHSIPVNNTQGTIIRLAVLGSGCVTNLLLGIGMPQTLKVFNILQAMCAISMTLMVSKDTCKVILDVPCGPDFVKQTWQYINTNLQLISSYWTGLPVAQLITSQQLTDLMQCQMLLSSLQYWLGFVFPVLVWYTLERQSRLGFLSSPEAYQDPAWPLLHQQFNTPWYFVLMLWLLVAVLVFCALWDIVHSLCSRVQ